MRASSVGNPRSSKTLPELTVGFILAQIIFYMLDLEIAFIAMDSLLRLCLLYTSPSPRDKRQSRMPSSA